MDLNAVQVVGGPLARATEAEVDAAQQRLWAEFPRGYREWVTTLGEGVLGGSLVRIYPPWRIEGELPEWRERIRKYWHWEKGRKVLPHERALESIILADTTQGDELVFHPGRAGRLFILPRHSQQIYEIEGDLLTAIEWMCAAGKLTRPFAERNFEPFDSRKQKKAEATAAPAQDTLEETVAGLVKWADRRALVKTAQKHFAEWLTSHSEPLLGLEKQEVPKEEVKPVLVNQTLIFRPEKYTEARVVTTLAVVAKDGVHLGEYQLVTNLDGSVSGYGVALQYKQAEALARNWLGVEV